MANNKTLSYQKAFNRVMNTHPELSASGCRSVPLANAQTRQARVLSLVEEVMAKTGQPYEQAFNSVRASYPELFLAMDQPSPVSRRKL